MAFRPRFRYTNEIVKNLIEIAEARAIVLNSPIVPKWDMTLRRDAVLKSVHASTAIEGNPLTMKEVTALADGKKVLARKKDRQEVLNYLSALNNLPEFASMVPFTGKDLLKVHGAVTKGTLDDSKYEGAYRKVQNYIVNRGTGEVVFTPPPPRKVVPLVNEFIKWYNSKSSDEIDSIIMAGIVHYELVRIHPFVDGNGRTTRVLAAMTLYRRGFDTKRYFALDDYYDRDRRSYYEALNNVDDRTQDLTDWLEYFTDGVSVCVGAVRDRVVGLSRDIKVPRDKGQISLTNRQTRIVELMIRDGKTTAGRISDIFGISRQAALKEMNKLVALKVVELVGERRGAHYILV